MFGRGLMWHNLGRPVMLGPLDGRAAIFIVLAMYHWSLWTLGFSILGMFALFLVERNGYTLPNLFRRTQVLIAGRHRPHQSSRRLRVHR